MVVSTAGAPSRSWVPALCTAKPTRWPAVSDDVALSPLDSGSAESRPLNSRWWLRNLWRAWSGPLASHHDKGVVDDLPAPFLDPAIEVVLDRIGRKVAGELAPLAAGGRDVEHRINNPAQFSRARATKPALLGHERLNQKPLSIGQVACVVLARPSILRSSVGPGNARRPRSSSSSPPSDTYSTG